MIINGDIGSFLGINMFSGKIIINGNAGLMVGYNMVGGCIEINGDYKSISENCNGTIYQNKKQLLNNGVPINYTEIKWDRIY